jgi:hypothetical protein
MPAGDAARFGRTGLMRTPAMPVGEMPKGEDRSGRLSRLTVPMVRAVEDKLKLDRSPTMVRKARVSLGALLTDAQERGARYRLARNHSCTSPRYWSTGCS